MISTPLVSERIRIIFDFKAIFDDLPGVRIDLKCMHHNANSHTPQRSLDQDLFYHAFRQVLFNF